MFCRPEANNSTDFALATAEKVFDILQGYFAIPPKSDKLGLTFLNFPHTLVVDYVLVLRGPKWFADIFALPKLEVPAMSSDGLILIREDFLLYDQRLNNIEEKVRIVQVVAHEITKQARFSLLSPTHTLW